MHPQEVAIVKSLVCVAWADGHLAAKEQEVVDAVLEAFGASEEQANEIREYAKTRRTLDELALDELSDPDCQQLLQHAVYLSFADGHQDDTERALLDDLAKRLPLSTEMARDIVAQTSARAKSHLNLL